MNKELKNKSDLTLIDFLTSNQYRITKEDIVMLNKYIDKQNQDDELNEINEFKNRKDVEVFEVTIKGWDDYDGDEYEFHSPPDCMYYKDDSIHADIIETYGHQTFKAWKYKNATSYTIFGIEDYNKIDFEEWTLKNITKVGDEF